MTVGRVGQPQGLDGLHVVEDASEGPRAFALGATLVAGGEAARVVGSKRARGRPLPVKLIGVGEGSRIVARSTVISRPHW